ncbi:hypothetical protein BU15DRAFT_89084 [Melanogaster broomeanus]|nr:hypothetical protein BU15DRAFT_89084 [Melanogaster broomeanus]
MVILAASICTKGGKAVLSRQFHPMTRTRIESLLASFPKLIPANSQHTSVETSEVRYVYQPLEDLYILLITNKASNILQDIETLHLFARVLSDMCKSVNEREIQRQSFELLGAFDEIVSLGYREQVNLMQVRSVLEMESHEERIQEIIARNKEAEAKEELKRQQQKRTAAVGGAGGSSYLGGGAYGYSSVPRFDAPEATVPRTASPAPAAASRAPQFKTGGMKLGSKKTRQAELLDALGGEVLAVEEMSTPPTPIPVEPPTLAQKDARASLPAVSAESVHVGIRETVSLSLIREGGVKSMELKGDMNLQVSDPANAHIKLVLASFASDFGSDLQFKQHPNVANFEPGQEKVVALKDPSRAFPNPHRYAGQDESYVPFPSKISPTILPNNCTCEVNIEYELENDNITLYDVAISIPLPASSYSTVSNQCHDEYLLFEVIVPFSGLIRKEKSWMLPLHGRRWRWRDPLLLHTRKHQTSLKLETTGTHPYLPSHQKKTPCPNFH